MFMFKDGKEISPTTRQRPRAMDRLVEAFAQKRWSALCLHPSANL